MSRKKSMTLSQKNFPFRKVHNIEMPMDLIKRSDENIDLYKCQQCNKSFDNKQSLRAHARYGNLVYSCGIWYCFLRFFCFNKQDSLSD